MHPGRNFATQALQHNVAVHAWTERLEVEFVDAARFATAEEELRYLLCELRVDGIFAENVDVGVRVAVGGCEGWSGAPSSSGSSGSNSAGSAAGSGSGSTAPKAAAGTGGYGFSSSRSQCPTTQTSSTSQTLVAAGSALLGLVLGSLLTYVVNHKWSRRRMRRGVGRRGMAVPSHVVDEHNGDNGGHHHQQRSDPAGYTGPSTGGTGGGDNGEVGLEMQQHSSHVEIT